MKKQFIILFLTIITVLLITACDVGSDSTNPSKPITTEPTPIIIKGLPDGIWKITESGTTWDITGNNIETRAINSDSSVSKYKQSITIKDADTVVISPTHRFNGVDYVEDTTCLPTTEYNWIEVDDILLLFNIANPGSIPVRMVKVNTTIPETPSHLGTWRLIYNSYVNSSAYMRYQILTYTFNSDKTFEKVDSFLYDLKDTASSHDYEYYGGKRTIHIETKYKGTYVLTNNTLVLTNTHTWSKFSGTPEFILLTPNTTETLTINHDENNLMQIATSNGWNPYFGMK